MNHDVLNRRSQWTRGIVAVSALALLVAGCAMPFVQKGSAPHIRAVTLAVDGPAIEANATTTRDWPTVGLDYSETRFSRLSQVDSTNVARLGLAWTYDLETKRGVEATPLVVDGIMFQSSSWSVVHAIDVRTGRRLWTYDPKVPREYGSKGCCDVVNRGVAVYRGKVYLGSFDGRLIALDAATGLPAWERQTVIDPRRAYTITGAPRVVNGKVIIGNGGAEYGVRGYVTAYDAQTGEQVWRWFTVPGDPSLPPEDESMARAAKTWDPAGRYWESGGGGTAWDGMAFDPKLNLLYIGTGNGSPWNRDLRSPAGGDNLYLASIVALDSDTGRYVWHYQETPGDNWDYTSSQPMILADLRIGGRDRKVILHAPKNGFFFVIDRTNGEFISAKNFVDVNWATGYDAAGRPIEIADARSSDKRYDSIPGPAGAHNWHPMSFSPATGLVYLPAQNVPSSIRKDPQWKFNEPRSGQPHAGVGWNLGILPDAPSPGNRPFGRLIAWDPVRQKEVWRQEYASPSNGGTLATAGNLVFQGTADGRFIAYDAANGRKLWEAPTGAGVMAAPSTYMVDGRQYVSVAVGWGGSYGLMRRASNHEVKGTVFTFALDAKGSPPAFVDYRMQQLVSGVKYDPRSAGEGRNLYISHCVYCHGVPGVDRGGALPNLAYVGGDVVAHLENFVFKGPFMSQGMPDFTGKLSPEDVEKIKAFILGTADAIRGK